MERDRGSQSPVSFQPPPRGANKIYRSDEVFLIEKTQTNDISQTQFPYNAPARSNKIYKSDEVFLIDDTKKAIQPNVDSE